MLGKFTFTHQALCVATCSGMSFGVLNFPKNQRKNLMDFCPESENWLNEKNKGPLLYTNFVRGH
jgi:hypothetical protein